MKDQITRYLGAGLVVGLLLQPVGLYADQGGEDISALKSEIQLLKSRLAELETKVASAPQVSSGAVASSDGGSPTLALPSMVEGLELSGYVDTTYTYNYNSPDGTANRLNRLRIFDVDSNSFLINAVELDIKKNVDAENRVGFRTDLVFGTDSEVVGSVTAGLGNQTDEFDLQQAYVEVLAPTSNWGLNDLDIKMGRFVTPIGAEVIESKDNWNLSRGLLFGWAIPFTHTGVLTNYPFKIGEQNMHLSTGIVNGWDVVDDNNNGKTFLWQFGVDGIQFSDISKLTVYFNGTRGAEQAINGLDRTLYDLVAIYNTPWKKLTLMYNYDYGVEEQMDAFNLGTLNREQEDAIWSGHAFYARYDINDKWSLSGRAEYFNDPDNVRMAFADYAAGTGADYYEMTGTLEYRPWANFIARLEYRHDGVSIDMPAGTAVAGPFFDEGLAGRDQHQDTIAGQLIYTF